MSWFSEAVEASLRADPGRERVAMAGGGRCLVQLAAGSVKLGWIEVGTDGSLNAPVMVERSLEMLFAGLRGMLWPWVRCCCG